MKGTQVLMHGDVEVLRADLDAQDGRAHLLSLAERMRSSRFRRAIDRDRYVAARGLLRLLLAERLDEDPVRIRIVDGGHGKPRLAERDALGFNLSHSDGDALFAFAAAGDVGIDVERIRPVDCVRLSETSFSKREREQLLGLDPDRRLAAFFDGWVRKEAVIKADGRGMSLAPGSFQVSLLGTARVIAPPPGDDVARWSLMSLDTGPAVRAALALRR